MALTKVTNSMISGAAVNVRDYGATGNGTDDDTNAFEAAFSEARTNVKEVFIPVGTYRVEKPIQLTGGVTVRGASLQQTQIYRTSTTPETIRGTSVNAVFYVEGGWNHISDLNIRGSSGAVASSVTGILFGANIAAKGSVTNVDVNTMAYGLRDLTGLFLYTFNNMQLVSCGVGVDFSSDNQKTSITFNQVYAANTGTAFNLKLVNYSALISCAADNCNWGTKPGNPYGSGYGDPASSIGVYHFTQCDIAVTNLGSEGSYGNGVISQANTFITIDGMFSYGCMSEFVPDYTAYPNYAVGPIQTTTNATSMTIANAFNREWSNSVVATSYPTKPIADLLAFNYDEPVNGVQAKTQVFLTTFNASSPTVKGMGPIARNVHSMYTNYAAPTFNGTFAVGSYAKWSNSIKLTGTGTVITIPFTAQGGQNYKHTIKLKGIDGTVNTSPALPFEATFAWGGTTLPVTVTSTGLWNVTSVTGSGAVATILVTLSAARTNPIIEMELLSENPALIDFTGITIA
jgi:hypothetical protein